MQAKEDILVSVLDLDNAALPFRAAAPHAEPPATLIVFL